ncbi:MAG: segregation/condensation protein A [Candidatus Aenigmarchaeota archaeon]|nr:segregation/condensation protein A [Candidatus Aenigmarchaeota archaeon]
MEVLDLIITGSDFESVLKEIIVEEGLDPWNIDIVKLADSMLKYLAELEEINFRVPARFILVSAVLLRLKSESLIETEVKERELETLNIDGLEIVEPPVKRVPVRNITFEELTNALQKVMQSEEEKEKINVLKREKMEKILNFVELDIEDYTEKVLTEIEKIRNTSFYTITREKNLLETAKYFISILHLVNQEKVAIEQQTLFEDFSIRAR